MIRALLILLIAVFVVWCSATVKLGDYTCLGHIKRIWSADETKDLRKGVKEKATRDGAKEVVKDLEDNTKPMIDRMKRGFQAGVHEARKTDGDQATGATKDGDAAKAPGDATGDATRKTPESATRHRAGTASGTR